MPRISVIIPNYNHAKYLTKRIESILSQSYQDLEVIILDDYSTDNSTDIIEQYRQHPKVSKIVYNDKNSGGPFKQWEKGIGLAKGEYIWIAESDDWCENTLLEELVLPLNDNTNCVVSYCQSYCIQNENLISWQSKHDCLSEIFDGNTFIKSYMLINNTIFNASMVLWKKDLFQFISKEFTQFKFCGDWLFWIELARLGEVHISGRLLNYFRKHDNDVSGKATKNGLDLSETLKIFNILYRENLITDKEYNKIYKNQFKKYWKQRGKLDPQISREIQLLLKSPVAVGTSYYKTLLSAVWHALNQ